MMGRLSGRVAIVTGAARGLGLGISRQLLAEGARVLAVDVLADDLANADYATHGGDAVERLTLDLLREDAPDQVLSAAQAAFGLIDILVNNAGVGISGTIEDFSVDQWNRTLAINLTTPFRLCRMIVPQMAAAGYGRVVNISSMNGSMGMRGDAGYSASKAGLEALTRSVAADYGRFGVTANAVAPGSIETPLNRDILSQQGSDSPLMKIVMVNKPIPGTGRLNDIASAVAFFASEDARFVSGQVLQVDGGLTATRYVPDDEGRETARYLPKN